MFKLARGFKLPDEAVTYKSGLLGRTGTGKTNTAVVLAEQMIEKGYPIVIIDPQGDWYGLRSDYEIAILGGEHADIPLEASGGTIAADFVVNERVSVLFDLFRMGEGEMVQFAADFAKRLWQINREAIHVFLDEADLFAPQKVGKGHKAVCLGAWQNIVRRGRSRGLGCTMITQRSAVLNKDLLTQADPLFMHRLTAPQDLAAVEFYLQYHGQSRAQIRQMTAEVAKLKVGEAFVISPGTLEIEPTKVAVHKRKSFDSSATPEAGKSVRGPKSFAEVDLSALREQMSATIEKAKANDPKELKREVARLKKELTGQAPHVDSKAIDRAVSQAVTQRDRHWQGEIRKLEQAHGALVKRVSKIHSLSQMNGDAAVQVDQPPEVKRPDRMTSKASPRPAPTPSNAPAGDLDGPSRKIIDAIAWWESIGESQPTTAQVGFVAGYSPKGGSFNTYLSRLSTAGLIQRQGGVLKMTDSGWECASYPSEPPTLDDYHAELKRVVKQGPLCRILDVLISQRSDMTTETIANLAGYSAGGGSFNTYLSRLSSLGLIERKSGQVAPTTLLFPDGL